MITGFRHTGIVVCDLDAALHFYVDLLGLTVVKRQFEAGTHLDEMLGLAFARVDTVKLAVPGGGLLELLRFHYVPQEISGITFYGRICKPGFTHIALTVDDLRAEHARLTANGVRFISEPVRSGNALVAFAIDPEGNHLELVENIKELPC